VRGERPLRRMNTTDLRSMDAPTGVARRRDPLEAPARVLLVADVRLYRELLAGALADEDGIELAGSASCDVAAVAVGMFEPDVVLVDTASVSVPDGMRALAAALPEASIVGVGVPDDEDSLVSLLEAGAAGYVTAEQPLTELVAAVEAATQGELQCPPRMAAALARRMAALAAAEKRDTSGDEVGPRLAAQ
jgi:two-component system nitrate/nitrite response regulator NarL